MKLPRHLILIIFLFNAACKPAQKSTLTTVIDKANPDLVLNLMKNHPQYFDSILANPAQYKVQIIYTRIDRDNSGVRRFTDYFFNVNDHDYFYPASTVKLPIAILALQKLNELNIPGLDRNSTMITEASHSGQTEVYNDPTSADGRPSIAHYIKKIFLVSDNDASNRLYEFLGQEYINKELHARGFKEAQIIHRLSISLSEQENRQTNPIRFLDTAGKLIYTKPAETSSLKFHTRDTKLGRGFFAGGRLVEGPFDFSRKNRLLISSLHTILKSIIFPESVDPSMRFNLKESDYAFLRSYLNMYCTESDIAAYRTNEYWPNYVKFLLTGASKEVFSPSVRIFNKSGQAYGFLTDVAYIVDTHRNIEFMVSATIHCNSDGIYNDDSYDYENVGLPFLKYLGQVLYEYEIRRKEQ